MQEKHREELKKGVFEGKTCDSDTAVFSSNKTSSKMGGQKSIILASVRKRKMVKCEPSIEEAGVREV